MLGFERQVVASMLTTPDPGRRAAVEAFVDGTLRTMPEHLRAGVLAESVAFSTWAKLRPRRTPSELLASLDRSPVAMLRQYPRLFRSLVLFAEQESMPSPAAGPTP